MYSIIICFELIFKNLIRFSIEKINPFSFPRRGKKKEMALLFYKLLFLNILLVRFHIVIVNLHKKLSLLQNSLIFKNAGIYFDSLHYNVFEFEYK